MKKIMTIGLMATVVAMSVLTGCSEHATDAAATADSTATAVTETVVETVDSTAGAVVDSAAAAVK